jgi:GPH family glycoside/pentoside/hexuronide:cation symporter
MSGAIGMTIADLTTAYVTSAPKTFVLKLCIGLITGLIAHKVFHISEDRQRKVALPVATVISCACGMVFNMVVLPMWLEKDINGYPILMVTMSIIAIPLLLLEYFYTRERISEDVAIEHDRLDEKKPSLREQMKALLSNRYFVILFLIATVSGIVDNFKGGNVQYFYIKFMLGGAENPLMYTIYQVVTGVPMGIGAFAIYPIAKKVGIKNMTVGGYALVLIGSIMGWMFPDQMIPAMVGGFLRNVGWLPNAYIFATLMCFAYDSVEHKSHMRLEGMMGVAVLTALQALIYAPFAGGFESTILRMGFVDVEGIMPSVEVTNFMTLSFYLFDAILAAVVVITLPFVDVEKKLPEINAELLRRKKEAVLARGEEWIDPAEAERIEQEKAEAIREENRIADLKSKCAKKGLDFDTENAKYLAKQAKKKK